MANRKLIRPDMNELKKDLPSRSVRRKQTPPEQTNAEEFYYLKQMAAKTPMVSTMSWKSPATAPMPNCHSNRNQT